MAQLIDIALVSLSVGIAILAVIRYLIDLVQAPKRQIAGCSACTASCYSDSSEHSPRKWLEEIKTI